MAQAETRIGPWVLMDELGEGGDARIFRARYRPRDDDKQDLGRGQSERVPERVEAFTREAELLLMLDHPGIVKTISRGMNGGRVWIAMEYVEGEDLRTVQEVFVREGLRMKPQVALLLAADLCAAVAAAHALLDLRSRPLGLVHQDLSPRNVILDIKGQPRVVDFGTAWLSSRDAPTGQVTGTPGYMSPEQARGEALTQASDVYQIGIVLFELLTSSRAYPVESLPDALVLQTHAAGRRLGWPDHFEISSRIRAIVDQALHDDVSMRPPDAGALYHLIAPMVKDAEQSRQALKAVARDLVSTNRDRPAPLFV